MDGELVTREGDRLRRAAADALLELLWDGAEVVAVVRSADLVVLSVNEAFELLTGVPRREVVGRVVGSLGLWQEARTLAPLLRDTGINGDPITVVARSGETRLCHMWAKPLAREGVTVVVVRDATEAARTERLLAVEHAVVGSLATSSTIQDGAMRVIRCVCERLDWGLGDWWAVDRGAGVLRFGGASWRSPWCPDGSFEALAPGRAFRRGETMVGQAWAAGKPIWVEDPGAHCYRGAGSYTGMAFPAIAGGAVLGVFAFCVPPPASAGGGAVLPVDHAMLETAEVIGRHFALFALATPVHA